MRMRNEPQLGARKEDGRREDGWKAGGEEEGMAGKSGEGRGSRGRNRIGLRKAEGTLAGSTLDDHPLCSLDLLRTWIGRRRAHPPHPPRIFLSAFIFTFRNLPSPPPPSPLPSAPSPSPPSRSPHPAPALPSASLW